MDTKVCAYCRNNGRCYHPYAYTGDVIHYALNKCNCMKDTTKCRYYAVEKEAISDVYIWQDIDDAKIKKGFLLEDLFKELDLEKFNDIKYIKSYLDYLDEEYHIPIVRAALVMLEDLEFQLSNK